MIDRDMLYTREQRSNARKWLVLLAVASLVSLAIGLLAGSVFRGTPDTGEDERVIELEGEIEDLQSQIGQLQSQHEAVENESSTLVSALEAAGRAETDLRSQLADTNARVTTAETALRERDAELNSSRENISSLEEQNRELTLRVNALQSRVNGLDGLSEAAESHRLLLVELRRDPPEDREGAFEFWNTMKDKAVRANPALSSPADRVIIKIDNFFDWAERSPNAEPTSDEYAEWLAERVTSGAAGYQESADAFFKEALLSAISQLEAIVGRLN